MRFDGPNIDVYVDDQSPSPVLQRSTALIDVTLTETPTGAYDVVLPETPPESEYALTREEAIERGLFHVLTPSRITTTATMDDIAVARTRKAEIQKLASSVFSSPELMPELMRAVMEPEYRTLSELLVSQRTSKPLFKYGLDELTNAEFAAAVTAFGHIRGPMHVKLGKIEACAETRRMVHSGVRLMHPPFPSGMDHRITEAFAQEGRILHTDATVLTLTVLAEFDVTLGDVENASSVDVRYVR